MDNLCDTCQQAACYEGFDSCLACGVASLLIEQPDYLTFAQRTYPGTQWLRTFEAEWNRQLGALVSCGFVSSERRAS